MDPASKRSRKIGSKRVLRGKAVFKDAKKGEGGGLSRCWGGGVGKNLFKCSLNHWY